MNSPFNCKTIRCLAVVVILIVGVVGQMESVAAQEATEGVSSRERFEQALLRGRELAKECRKISLHFFDSSLEESHAWKEKWPDAANDLREHKSVLEKAAIDWFLECNEPDHELTQMAIAISNQVYLAGDFELTWKILDKVRTFSEDGDNPALQRRMALVGIKTNRFADGLKFLQRPDAREAIDALDNRADKNMFRLCPMLAANWERESELRKKEAEADDLPRVKFETSTGDVIVELYENEAPETVANFISLVESGFYDDALWHPVVKDLVAQTGAFHRVRRLPAPYLIKNESMLDDSRKHFAGSLSMVNRQREPLLPSSVFALIMLPNPELDWNGSEDDKYSQTVFGRIVSGMEHVHALPSTVEIDSESDEEKVIKGVKHGHIIKATVLRKRDHEYAFEKIDTNKK
ncbi:peptidylprolyl isomerase [Mariniblastus fucicola]|uniref:peptidylprolyl isomerase n=1 Tax=Mariniblastus fucicola TaxID=980251 RepID=A0A5B9P7I5_9BACT|nr:peptidylprolyl isomerase [Mariniblastus fucicola]QEG20566.1 Peptidyl-prolyl cis-trans isomerase B [Mariniblastus fucicola]